MDRPTRSQLGWSHPIISYDGTDWTTLEWSRASNTSAAKPFPWNIYQGNGFAVEVGAYVLLHSERSGFMGCRDQKHPQL